MGRGSEAGCLPSLGPPPVSHLSVPALCQPWALGSLCLLPTASITSSWVGRQRAPCPLGDTPQWQSLALGTVSEDC